jgi:perosamine synthetase
MQSSLEKWPNQIGVGTCELSNRAKKYVNEVLDTNRLSYGPFSKKFEAEFAAAHGCKFAVFVNSGTSALRISIAALKEKYSWQDGDEIIIPAITFVSDVNVITHNRLTPVFVDVDPNTYTLDPSLIEAKCTERTKAIIPTHLCGLPADMSGIMDVAEARDLNVIEDACESAYARYNDKPVGSFGIINCFSTYQAHIIATGIGGLTTTNDPDLAALLRSLANHGRDIIYTQIDDDKNKSDGEFKKIVSRRFSFLRPGYSYRATELEAAIGLAQIEEGIEDEIRKRQKNGQLLIETLSEYKQLQLPTWPEKCEHAFMMFPIVLKKEFGIDRDDLVHYLELQNIETRHLLPLINQPFVIDAFGDLSGDCRVAHHLNNNAFYVGCHPLITTEEISYIGRVFGEYFKLH